jgi:hypothetical protein
MPLERLIASRGLRCANAITGITKKVATAQPKFARPPKIPIAVQADQGEHDLRLQAPAVRLGQRRYWRSSGT